MLKQFPKLYQLERIGNCYDFYRIPFLTWSVMEHPRMSILIYDSGDSSLVMYHDV